MRHAPTCSEERLWRELRESKLGAPFKRQVVLGGRFIVDFFAARARLVVEVDGGYHAERAQADARRDRALRRLGYRVLRLEEELVMKHIEVALARIRECL
jgi:very-short-patch-repair endonuclease